jgi:hypothetical protein
MANIQRDGDLLILSTADTTSETSKTGFNLHALSPILLGLVIPFLAIHYIDPNALREVRFAVWIGLVVLFFIATGLFAYSAMYPGQIISVVFDRSQQSIEVLWRSALATTSQTIPFAAISALRVRPNYDDDGYPSPVAEIVLASRQKIELPEGTDEADVRVLKAAIGLG